MSAWTRLFSWSEGREADLTAWLARGAELGVSFTSPNGKHSDAAAVGEALKRAAACRCGKAVDISHLAPATIKPIPCESCGKPVEEPRECYAIPTCYACLPPPPPLPVAPWPPSAGLRRGTVSARVFAAIRSGADTLPALREELRDVAATTIRNVVAGLARRGSIVKAGTVRNDGRGPATVTRWKCRKEGSR